MNEKVNCSLCGNEVPDEFQSKIELKFPDSWRYSKARNKRYYQRYIRITFIVCYPCRRKSIMELYDKANSLMDGIKE